MTHECIEEPPSSFSVSNHFFDQLSLITIFSPTFIFDGIIFELMTSSKVSIMCIACLDQIKIITSYITSGISPYIVHPCSIRFFVAEQTKMINFVDINKI